MNIKALKLCARFALQPNQLGYCGRGSAPAKFQKCIINSDCKGVEEEIKKFIVLNPYLQTIAEVTGFDLFSYEVIEAYWLGNDLLKQFKPKHYQVLIKYLTKQGVPSWLISEIKAKKPKAFIPIHLFNILHVGVGRASGSVPFNIKSINNCMVRWGKITRIKNQESKIKVKIVSLKKESSVSSSSRQRSVSTSGIYSLKSTEEMFAWDKDLVPDLDIGDLVTVHWGWVANKSTKKEMKNLEHWTRELISSI